MKHYTHLIWDFNGTLLNDVDACIRCANSLLAAHGLPLLRSKAEYCKKFGFPIIDYYRRLGFDFEALKYADLAVEWVAYYQKESQTSRLYGDVPTVLRSVQRHGVRQWILSATELRMLEDQVAALGIRNYFDGLLGLDTIEAHSKAELGMQWKQAHPDASVLFVGDTDHDVQTAQKMGGDCILVARGHQSREHLESCGALFVANTLLEVLDFLEKNK